MVPDAEDHGKLAFAYAHGPLLSGFGTDDEIGLVCVWDRDTVPEDAPPRAEHVTQHDFNAALAAVGEGRVWPLTPASPLTGIAGFAYGVLLSDEEGAGTAARGAVSEFPQALAVATGQRLAFDVGTVSAALSEESDRWIRAELLTEALHHAYVAWFAAHERYFPGVRRRGEYARHFGLDLSVLELEDEVWRADSGALAADRYRAMAERILNDR